MMVLICNNGCITVFNVIIISTVAKITFKSSIFSGLESSGVISAIVTISGGIVSSRDISVPITFTAGTAIS